MTPFQPDRTIAIPELSVPSWYFDGPPRFDQDRPIYVDADRPERYYTARTAQLAIRRLAAGLRRWGVKRGDCVGIIGFNDISYPILVNSIVALGAIFAGANPSYTPSELTHHLKTTDISFLFAEPELLLTALKAADAVGLPRERILVFDHASSTGIWDGNTSQGGGGSVLGDMTSGLTKMWSRRSWHGLSSWRTLESEEELDWIRLEGRGEDGCDAVAGRLGSSGTTGLPKAASLSHYNFIAQHELVNAGNNTPKPWLPKRSIIPLPMFHVAAVPTVHFSPLRDGATLYIMRRFDLPKWLEYVRKYEANELALVPPIVVAVVNSPSATKEVFKSVRYATCGAAPLDKDTQGRLQALLPEDAVIGQVWGMTETTCIATQVPYPHHDKTGSVGTAVPNIELKLVDDSGTDITAYSTRGEICARGPTVIKGYYRNPEANARDWDADGFFHTGDIAYRSPGNGFWYIVDRKKELIKVRGFQVAPPEIEGVIRGMEGVEDVAVIGVGDGVGGELPRAFVVKKDGWGASVRGANGGKNVKRLSEEDVKSWVADRLAKYKRLEGGVVFVDAIPKNPSGKILKRVLRDMCKDEGVKAKL